MRLGKKQITLLKYAQNHGKIYFFWDMARLDALHRKEHMAYGRETLAKHYLASALRVEAGV
jgi:hypothetical protein